MRLSPNALSSHVALPESFVVTCGSPRISVHSVSFAEALMAPNDYVCSSLSAMKAPPSAVLHSIFLFFSLLPRLACGFGRGW